MERKAAIISEIVGLARELGFCLPVCIYPLYAYGGEVFTGDWIAAIGPVSSRGRTFDDLITDLRDRLKIASGN